MDQPARVLQLQVSCSRRSNQLLLSPLVVMATVVALRRVVKRNSLPFKRETSGGRPLLASGACQLFSCWRSRWTLASIATTTTTATAKQSTSTGRHKLKSQTSKCDCGDIAGVTLDAALLSPTQRPMIMLVNYSNDNLCRPLVARKQTGRAENCVACCWRRPEPYGVGVVGEIVMQSRRPA